MVSNAFFCAGECSRRKKVVGKGSEVKKNNKTVKKSNIERFHADKTMILA